MPGEGVGVGAGPEGQSRVGERGAVLAHVAQCHHGGDEADACRADVRRMLDGVERPG